MWTASGDSWTTFEPRFDGDSLDPERASSPWAGHRWFAYDLLRFRAPDRVVELGTHFGVSIFSFAQAVKDGGLRTELNAVDTWEGDSHAGFYGPEVLEQFERVRTEAYSTVSLRPHQMLFSEALDRFEDESVDLLHIDGFHSYESAQSDFESWLPKLAPGGIVLFHDVAPETGYSSADYWDDLSSTYPGFAFAHSFGLGVLFPKGTIGWEYLWSDEFFRWRKYYRFRWEAFLFGRQVDDLTRMVEDRDEAIRAQAAMIDARDEAIRAQAAMIDARDEAIRAQAAMIDARDEAIRAQAGGDRWTRSVP